MHWVLAIDHRNSFRALFPDATDAQRRRGKELVLDALLHAAAEGFDRGSPAILMDEEYGGTVIRRAGDAGVAVIVPVEVSGQRELAFLYGDGGFGAAIEALDPTYVKALVRYDPTDPPPRNEQQRSRLRRLQDWLEDHGRDWMLELLAPPSPGGDAESWDWNHRPRLTVQAVGELVDSGLRPAFWKLEGQASAADYAALAAATRCAGRHDSRCLVLGRGADAAAVERWIRLAAPLLTYGGFAVGRSLWHRPLADVLAGRCDEPAAIAAISANYRQLVAVYLEARRRSPLPQLTPTAAAAAGPPLDSRTDPAPLHLNPGET